MTEVRTTLLDIPPPYNKGLFATRDFRKGEIVALYATPGDGSVEYTKAAYEALPDKDQIYGFDVGNNVIVDATKSTNIGKRANTLKHRNNVKFSNNWWSTTTRPRITLKALFAIKKGAEIYVSYGRSYYGVDARPVSKAQQNANTIQISMARQNRSGASRKKAKKARLADAKNVADVYDDPEDAAVAPVPPPVMVPAELPSQRKARLMSSLKNMMNEPKPRSKAILTTAIKNLKDSRPKTVESLLAIRRNWNNLSADDQATALKHATRANAKEQQQKKEKKKTETKQTRRAALPSSFQLWHQALNQWRGTQKNAKDLFCVPKKGSRAYAKVKRIHQALKDGKVAD